MIGHLSLSERVAEDEKSLGLGGSGPGGLPVNVNAATTLGVQEEAELNALGVRAASFHCSCGAHFPFVWLRQRSAL